MTDQTTALIGTILPAGVGRDAVHIAVAPAVAKSRMIPGQSVAADGSGFGTQVGIVDPFLPAPVEIGQRFFIFLKPGTITSLRHEWTHPAFAAMSDSGLEP